MIPQIVLLSLFALSSASPYIVSPYANPGYEPVYEAKPEPYSFGYDTKDEYGSILSRKEEGDELGNKRGSYGFVDPHGIYRQVDYVADENGFRAVVKTNEPGTESQNPANVEILSEAVPVKYDAPAAYGRAPVPAAYVAPAYSKPAVAVAPAAPLAPLSPAAPLAPLSPAAPIYEGPAPAAYAPVAHAYGGPAVYGPSAYAPVPEAYGPVPAAYSSAPLYEPLAPQSYAGPSYEQLSDKASQPTESRS